MANIFAQWAQTTNIAEFQDDERLTEISREVYDGIKSDLDSRSQWEETLQEYIKLSNQVVEKKSWPWPNAANVNYPLLTTAATQFAARAYPALVPETNVVRGRIIGFDPEGSKMERAIRIGKHMSYQILEEMDNWEEEMDKLLIVIPILGCAFKKTYRNIQEDRNESTLVLPQDLIVDYYTKSLDTAYRKTHRFELNKNDVISRMREGIYLDVELDDPSIYMESADHSQKIHKITPPSKTTGATPYIFYECHTYLDLDDDGYEEPYIITLESVSRKVVRIVPRFNLEDVQVNDQEEIIRIKPIEYFTKFPFIPNPDGGFYDLGYGALLGPINHTINTSINQLLDGATLSNLGGGFLGRGIRSKRGALKFSPGEWISLNATGDDLRKNIFPMPVTGPSPVLFSLLTSMIDAGRTLGQTMDSQVGEDPGQNQKATTTLAVQEQGMKVFNSVYKRIHRSLKQEFKKLFELNKIYLKEEDYFTILDPMAERAETIYRADYDSNEADVIPASDPNSATEQQKLTKALVLQELADRGQVNPQEVTRRILEAQEQPGIERLMTLPESAPDPKILLEEEKIRNKKEIDMIHAELEALKIKLKAAEIQNKSESDDLGNLIKTADLSIRQSELEKEGEESGDTES